MFLDCKQCGNDFEHKALRSFCSKECRGDAQRMRQSGKKRPEHSKFIKGLIASGENEAFNRTIMKKGELFNKEVNSIAFKKKRLEKNGIEYDDENLEQLYNKFQNGNINGIKSWRSKIKNAIQKYPDHQLIPFLIVANNWNDEELEARYYKEIHGIFTSLNLEKRGKIKIPVECSKGIINVRSSYEVNWIKFLDENDIEWDYEPAWFRLKSGKFYLPDFRINYKNEIIWLEVKGAFWGNQNEFDYMENIINPFIEFISPIKFLLSFTAFPTLEKFNEELNNA